MMQLSRCFHATSQFEYALKYYDRCIELQPEDYRPRLGRGQCLLKLERFPEALESIEAALELKPGLISALRDKGKSLCQTEGLLQYYICYVGHGQRFWTQRNVITKWGSMKTAFRLLTKRLKTT